MVKALGLSPSKSSSLAGTGEMLIWDTTRPSRPCSKAATRTSVLLTALSRNPLVSCASLEPKRLSALTNPLPGISGSQRRREHNTGLLKVLASLLNRS